MDTCGGDEHGMQIVRCPVQLRRAADVAGNPHLALAAIVHAGVRATQEDLSLLISEPLPPAARPRAAYVLSISRSLGIWCAMVSQGVHDHLECG